MTGRLAALWFWQKTGLTPVKWGTHRGVILSPSPLIPSAPLWLFLLPSPKPLSFSFPSLLPWTFDPRLYLQMCHRVFLLTVFKACFSTFVLWTQISNQCNFLLLEHQRYTNSRYSKKNSVQTCLLWIKIRTFISWSLTQWNQVKDAPTIMTVVTKWRFFY